MKKIALLLSIILMFVFISHKSEAFSPSLGQVVTSGSNLNLRTNASTSSNIKMKLSNGTIVEILDDRGDFYYVNYKGTYGYAHEDYINILTNKKVKTTANLNIRQSASTNATILKVAVKNTEMYLIESYTNWSKVYIDGITGYAYNNYLVPNSSMKLNVTSYKQFDSRWAKLEIVPGKTMQKIGCLTTSFAMTESYRQGKTLTPKDMMSILKYTASGDAYWPSIYTTSTASSYLQTIYNNLTRGVPTIIGATGSSMHFVVVTGFTGGSISPNNFLINDPGSNYRTTLSDFFASYPNFYKIAYY